MNITLPAPVRQDGGFFVADVRNFGANPDNGATDNTAAFQAAVDWLSHRLDASLNSARGIVRVPEAPLPYCTRSPVFIDRDRIEVVGEGLGSRVMPASGRKHPLLVFGIRRTQGGGLAIDPTNRPSAAGILDASVTTPRFGIRTKGNTFAQFTDCPPAAGVKTAFDKYSDNWSTVRQLTLETIIRSEDGGPFKPGSPLMGQGRLDPNEPAPLVMKFWDQTNKVLCLFKTSDQTPGESLFTWPCRGFSFSLGAGPGPFYLVVQIDLVSGVPVVSVYVNKNAVPVSLDLNMATPAVPGLTFAINDHFPFMVGANGVSCDNGGAPTGVDLGLYGLRISNTIRYSGTAQTRVDNPALPVNHQGALFTDDANTVALLPLTDPADPSRVVTVQNGGATFGGVSSGLFLHTTFAGVECNAVRNLSLWGSEYGQNVALGKVVDFNIDHVESLYGWQAVGSIPTSANYYLKVRDSYLAGYDAAISVFMQGLWVDRVQFKSAGRCTIRGNGSGGTLSNLFVERGSPVSECFFKGRALDYGGQYAFTNVEVDYEGNSFTRSPFYMEAHPQAPATSLVLRDVFLGTIGHDASVIQLRDCFPESDSVHPCWLTADNVQVYTYDYAGFVDVDGPNWYGNVHCVSIGKGNRIVHRQRFGTRANVQIHEYALGGLPSTGTWYAGAHVIHVQGVVPGGVSEYRCLQTGTYGTPQPPLWGGVSRMESLSQVTTQ